MEIRNIDAPDETRKFQAHGHVDVVSLERGDSRPEDPDYPRYEPAPWEERRYAEIETEHARWEAATVGDVDAGAREARALAPGPVKWRERRADNQEQR